MVTTDVPGCRETVIPGETGLLFKSKDKNAAYKAMTIVDRINFQLGWMSFNDEKGKEPDFYVVDTCTKYMGELQFN